MSSSSSSSSSFSSSSRLGEKEVNDALRGVFHTLDSQHNGWITIHDLERVKASEKISPDQLETIFGKADLNQDGKITLQEFCERVGKSAFVLKAQALFCKLDKDHSGGLTRDEVVAHLSTLGQQENAKFVVDMIMRSGDFDHDQKLSFKEFLILLTRVEEHLPILHSLANTGGKAKHGLPLMDPLKDLGRIAVDIWNFDDATAFFKETTTQKVVRTLFCAATAGIIAKTSVAPFQRVKLLFQVTDDAFSMGRAFRRGARIIREEGFLQLWRGNSAVVARTLPYVSIHFLAHDIAEDYLRTHPTESLSAGRKFTAGGFAGVCGTVCTYPLDLIRARLAVGPIYSWQGVFHDIYSRRGIGGFYRGLFVTLAGIIPYTGVAWTVKGKLNDRIRQMKKRKLFALEKLACGACAGLIAQGMTYPLEMVRRRMQMPTSDKLGNSSVRNTLQTLVRKEGFAGLFKGFSLNVIKGPIAIGISFATFDTLKEWFRLDPPMRHR
mmetsp:Transcript_15167/g.21209  ORF Transcript_15167/g.21209 Transcript_15167/m.21209 type:complete len:494 (+) Transcript_15167:1068-2549(+)